MINIKWPRWTTASIVKHFTDNISGVDVFVEGEERPTNPTNLVELRIDGPEIRELHQNYFRLYVEINILVQVTIDDTNLYSQEDVIGEVCNAFSNIITVYKKGLDSEDDGSFVGCYNLITRGRNADGVKVFRFGQIEQDIRILQSTIEGHYEMYLNT